MWLVCSCIDEWTMVRMISICCYDYDYTYIVLIWLILQMRYPPLNYIEVCWLCFCFVLAGMVSLWEKDQR